MMKKVMTLLLNVVAFISVCVNTQDRNDMHLMPYSGIRRVDKKIMLGQCPAYYSSFFKCIGDDEEILVASTPPVIHWFVPFPKWYEDAILNIHKQLCERYKCEAANARYNTTEYYNGHN